MPQRQSARSFAPVLPATDDVHRRVLAVLTFLDVQ